MIDVGVRAEVRRQARRVVVQINLTHDRRDRVASFTDQGALRGGGIALQRDGMVHAPAITRRGQCRQQDGPSSDRLSPHEASPARPLEDAPTADEPDHEEAQTENASNGDGDSSRCLPWRLAPVSATEGSTPPPTPPPRRGARSRCTPWLPAAPAARGACGRRSRGGPGRGAGVGPWWARRRIRDPAGGRGLTGRNLGGRQVTTGSTPAVPPPSAGPLRARCAGRR